MIFSSRLFSFLPFVPTKLCVNSDYQQVAPSTISNYCIPSMIRNFSNIILGAFVCCTCLNMIPWLCYCPVHGRSATRIEPIYRSSKVLRFKAHLFFCMLSGKKTQENEVINHIVNSMHELKGRDINLLLGEHA